MLVAEQIQIAEQYVGIPTDPIEIILTRPEQMPRASYLAQIGLSVCASYVRGGYIYAVNTPYCLSTTTFVHEMVHRKQELEGRPFDECEAYEVQAGYEDRYKLYNWYHQTLWKIQQLHCSAAYRP